jgi:hypothetical protein
MDDADDGAERWLAPSVIGSAADDTSPASQGRRADVRFSLEVARAVCARVAAGESQVSICAEAGMPSRSTVFCWARDRPTFAKALAKAKAVGGRKANGQPSSYCAATAHEIFERMCEGETVVSICRDPAMPSFSTIYYWRRQFADFRAAMETARKIQAERFCDLGWEIAEGVTPETAFATRVKLAQLRWTASVLAPRDYGRFKVQEPPQETTVQTICIRSFAVELREDGARRVVAYRPNPTTGKVEREPAGDWERPGFTIEEARYLKLKGELAAHLQGERAARPAPEPSEDDEQWL